MEARVGHRFAALAGAASILAGAVGGTITDSGADGINPDTSPATVATYFAQHMEQARLGAALSSLAAVLALMFAGALWTRLDGWGGVVAAAGAALLAVFWWVGAALDVVKVVAGDFSNGDVGRLLVLAEWDTARLLAVPVLAMVIGALASRSLLPRWFRWLSMGFAVLLVLALVPGLGPAGGLAVVGALWVVVASVLFAAERAA